jgi:CRP-like cAMP-binding protein
MGGELSTEDIHRLRASIERFVRMSNEEWELLAPYLELRDISRGKTLAVEGKRSDEIGFMLKGSMRHYYTRDGEERTTYFYFENHFVTSYISCITGQPSQITIEALTDCRLLIFRYGRLKQLYDISQSWERFGRLIAEYLAMGLEERMAGLLMQSPEERYISLLESNKQKIIERIPQHYIASYLGITPVSLSRIRSRLAEK